MAADGDGAAFSAALSEEDDAELLFVTFTDNISDLLVSFASVSCP